MTEDPTETGSAIDPEKVADAPLAAMEKAFARTMALQRAGRLDRAITGWRAMLMQDPNYIPALNNLGIALRRLGRIAESEAVLRAGLERAPQQPELLTSLGQTLWHWGRIDAAKAAFMQAAAHSPVAAEPHHALARLYLEEGNIDEAERSFNTALAVAPRHVPSLAALGELTYARGGLAKAQELFERVVTATTDTHPMRLNAEVRLSDLALVKGDYEKGFQEKARLYRLEDQGLPDNFADITGLPMWDGGPLTARRLTIVCDTDLDETILLIRMARSLPKNSVQVLCPPAMRDLLRGCRFIDTLASTPQDLKRTDFWVPLSLLPGLIDADLAGSELTPPYLRADPSSLASWRRRLPAGYIPIGIKWSGTRLSVPLSAFAPLAEIDGFRLVSLQKGPAADDIDAVPFPILDLGTSLDLESEAQGGSASVDTAALLTTLPLIVTVEDEIAHIAGALDRQGIILLRPAPHWSWSLESDVSPWYPSLDLVRPTPGESWRAVLSGVAKRVASARSLFG